MEALVPAASPRTVRSDCITALPVPLAVIAALHPLGCQRGVQYEAGRE
jgi:hypothetical protein